MPFPCNARHLNLYQRTIVKKRRRLEYRLLRRPARIADYLRAIQVCDVLPDELVTALLECVQYEVNVDLLRKHRMKVSLKRSF